MIRDKDTGEIYTNALITVAPYTDNVRGCHVRTYKSIAGLMEKWEDYEPKKPLTKNIYKNIEPITDQDIINMLRSENVYLKGVIGVYEKFLKDRGFIKEEE